MEGLNEDNWFMLVIWPSILHRFNCTLSKQMGWEKGLGFCKVTQLKKWPRGGTRSAIQQNGDQYFNHNYSWLSLAGYTGCHCVPAQLPIQLPNKNRTLFGSLVLGPTVPAAVCVLVPFGFSNCVNQNSITVWKPVNSVAGPSCNVYRCSQPYRCTLRTKSIRAPSLVETPRTEDSNAPCDRGACT